MLTLAGCTEWVQPGISPQVRDRDLAACTALGHRTTPADTVVVTRPGHYVSGSKQCWRNKKKDREECSYTAGHWTSPSDEVVDANKDARDAYIEDCMYRRGYFRK